jgi:hypothetical protein
MAIKNLHGTLNSKHQQQFSLNVSGGIARNRLLGSYTLPPCLTGAVYKMSSHSCCILWIYRLGLIYCSHMSVLQHIFFLHSCLHKRVSKTKDRISAPTAWSACSPNLISLNSYLWGQPKSTVYATILNDIQDLQQQIRNGFQMTQTTPGIFQ